MLLLFLLLESNKRPPSIAEIEALLYGHETRLHGYEQENQNLVTPSLNFTHGPYARGTQKGNSRGSARSGSGPARGRGMFAKFILNSVIRLNFSTSGLMYPINLTSHCPLLILPLNSLFLILLALTRPPIPVHSLVLCYYSPPLQIKESLPGYLI